MKTLLAKLSRLLSVRVVHRSICIAAFLVAVLLPVGGIAGGYGDNLGRALRYAFQGLLEPEMDHSDLFEFSVPKDKNHKTSLYALGMPSLPPGQWLKCEDIGFYSYNDWRTEDVRSQTGARKRYSLFGFISWNRFNSPVFLSSERYNYFGDGARLGRFSVAVSTSDLRASEIDGAIFNENGDGFSEEVISFSSKLTKTPAGRSILSEVRIVSKITQKCDRVVIFSLEIDRVIGDR